MVVKKKKKWIEVIYKNKKETEYRMVVDAGTSTKKYFYLVKFMAEGFHFYFEENFANELLKVIESLTPANRKEIANRVRNAGRYLIPCTDKELSDEEIFENLDALTFRGISAIFDYLDETLDSKCWHSWLATGDTPGDMCYADWCYVWIYSESGLSSLGIDPNEKFEDNNESDFLGKDWQDIWTHVLYWPCVYILKCDSNFNEINRTARAIYCYSEVDPSFQYNKSKKLHLDEYMKEKYDMTRLKVRERFL